MARPGPPPITVGRFATWMKVRLRQLARSKRGPADVSFRARIIRALAFDPCVAAVAARLDTDPKTVRLWRDRFIQHGLKGPRDKGRSGRPRRIRDVTRCEVVALACDRPSAHGVAHRHTWTFDTLHAAYKAKHPDIQISRTSIVRILNHAELRPHRVPGWIHSKDPEFRAKVTHICELYLRPPRDPIVLCVDEKTGMQALGRKHPTKWAGHGRPGRREYEYEYKRNGSCTLFSAFNTRDGHVVAEVSKTRKAPDLLRFMKKVAQHYPKGEVLIVWDNLNIHHEGPSRRWTESNRRHGGRFHFHYTPLHASWINQVALFFARVQRRVLRHGSFNSVSELTAEVLGFIDHWNRHERKPYRWTFRGYPLEAPNTAGS